MGRHLHAIGGLGEGVRVKGSCLYINNRKCYIYYYVYAHTRILAFILTAEMPDYLIFTDLATHLSV